MSFSGNGQKLIGNDGTVFDVVKGTEASGDGATALSAGHYLITAVGDPTSGWPATSGATGATQVGVGRVLEVLDGGTAITPEAGDSYVPLTLTELCDLGGWSLQFTSDEVEITGFCDDVKKYRAGKDDAQGSMTGVFRIGTTDKTDGIAIARTFIDIVEQDGGDSVDVYEKLKGAKIVKLVLNKEGRPGDFYAIYAGVELFGFDMGAEQGANPQSFDSSFRFSSVFAGAADVEVLPTLYRRARGA
jgi:hypothetical protein